MDEYAQRRRVQQRRRARRRRKRIRAITRLGCMMVLLAGLLIFARQISKLNLGNLTWAGNSSGIPAGYVDEADTSPGVPVLSEGDALKKRIHKLAKRDSDYQEIYNHYDEYPESLMLALSNNPEMLDFVKVYHPKSCCLRYMKKIWGAVFDKKFKSPKICPLVLKNRRAALFYK